MHQVASWRPSRLAASAFVATLALAGMSAAPAIADGGALFTETNDPAGNAVVQYDRGGDGSVSLAGTVQTGGSGSADAGGRQGAVTLSDDGRTVYAVNAGSNSVSVLRRDRRSLRVLGSVPSGGPVPVSVDEREGRVYVLNSGDASNAASVTAFRALSNGALLPIPGGRRDLPGAEGAAQVSVSPDGRVLVISERLSNRLETVPVERLGGRLGEPIQTASRGTVPFGFAFAGNDHIVVSEAGASTVSSYRLGFLSPRCRRSPFRRPSGRALRAGSQSPRRGATPTPATPRAASAASRSVATQH